MFMFNDNISICRLLVLGLCEHTFRMSNQCYVKSVCNTTAKNSHSHMRTLASLGSNFEPIRSK